MFKEKICISRIDKMGDMILTLPVIKSIKIQIPNSEVHVLASIENSKLSSNSEIVSIIASINGVDMTRCVKMCSAVILSRFGQSFASSSSSRASEFGN